jgi:hypothetical protein
MKTGANRKTIGTSVFLLAEERPQPLGKIARTDFARLPEAERDIVNAFVTHRSLLSALQNAPNQKILQEKLDGLARTIQHCRDQMASFLVVGKDHKERMEFRSAISELLLDYNLDRQNLDILIEDTVDDLAQINIFLTVARRALEQRVCNGELVEVSSRRERYEFFRRLRAILKRHGLDDKTGEHSLIVHLVIRIEGKWKLTAKSGPEASQEAEVDRRIRKDLAAEIKAAVKEQKGG